jgi:hypothetical protein
VRCQGAQSRPAAVLFTDEQETRHRSELALAGTSRPGERKLVGESCGFGEVVGGGLLGQAADFAVAEPVVAEGEDLAGDRDFGDLGAAALGDPFVVRPQRPAAGGGVLRGFGESPAQDGGALAGDVPEARFAVGAMNGRGQSGPLAEVFGGREACDLAISAMISIAM